MTTTPTPEQRAVVFRSEDGREVKFGVLYDALAQLSARQWDALQRQTVIVRLADSIGVELI